MPNLIALWAIEDDFYGMKAGDYFASGFGGQIILVLPRINTVVVHRVNIYVPDIDIDTASNAPFQFMSKIIQAILTNLGEVMAICGFRDLPENRAAIKAALMISDLKEPKLARYLPT